MGGLDIFKTYKVGTAWSPVQNLKPPINSGSDDFAYMVDYQAKKAAGRAANRLFHLQSPAGVWVPATTSTASSAAYRRRSQPKPVVDGLQD
jgi:hypothetical protein